MTRYYDAYDYDDPPLYAQGYLASKDELALQREWERQCNIHDNAVDHRPMGDPVIEDAAARIRLIEVHQKSRGFTPGPSKDWLTE